MAVMCSSDNREGYLLQRGSHAKSAHSKSTEYSNSISISFSLARSFLTGTLLLLTVLYLAAVALPSPPRTWGAGLDASWVHALNMAHRDGLVFGRDIVWTYGPLGYLRYFDIASGSFGWGVLYQFITYSVWLLAALRLIHIHESRAVALWMMALAALASMVVVLKPDRMGIAALAVAVLVLVEQGWRRQGWIFALALISTIAALVKLNEGVECWLLFLTLVAITAWRKYGVCRKALGSCSLMVLMGTMCFIAAFGIVNGGIRYLIPYVVYGWNVASGYSLSMSVVGPLWQATLAILTVVGLLVWGPILCQKPKLIVPALVPSAILAFFTFKEAMIRQDNHAADFQILIALASLPLLALAKTTYDRRLFTSCQAASFILGCSIMAGSLPDFGRHLQDGLMLRTARASLSAYLQPTQTKQALFAANESQLAGLVMDTRYTQQVKSSKIDAIPWDIARIRANNWHWSPRPVIQSYSAYMPELDKLNAQYLESPHAPEHVLLAWSAIDGRNPFLDDVSTWRVLLQRYNLKILDSDAALLRLRTIPRQAGTRTQGSFDIEWNQPLSLPAGNGFLLMKADIVQSWFGVLMNASYRTDSVNIDATYASGEKVSWRAVFPNLRNGFIVSTLPRSLQEYACLFSDAACGARVASIVFRTNAPREFGSKIHISLSEWRLEDARDSTESTNRAVRPDGHLVKLWAPRDPLPANVQSTLERGDRSLTVHPTGIDSQLSFKVDQPLNDFQAIVVRARFSRSDRVDLFFGRQVDGRGVTGVVPEANRWFDIYFFVGANRYWLAEAGSSLRFDPASELGIGGTIDISGIWGFRGTIPSDSFGSAFYPAIPPR
jgi:hypothetical protein